MSQHGRLCQFVFRFAFCCLVFFFSLIFYFFVFLSAILGRDAFVLFIHARKRDVPNCGQEYRPGNMQEPLKSHKSMVQRRGIWSPGALQV